MQSFEEIKTSAMNKTYDYLDQRNLEFDADFETFLSQTDALKENIASTIEKNYESVWETPQGVKFLSRFEKASIDLLEVISMILLIRMSQ